MAPGQDGPPSERRPARPGSRDEVDVATHEPAAADGDTGRASEVEPETAGKVKEIGGPKGPEPTRYGDWEKGGRCSDF